jgi:hypothetical protein
MTDLRAENDPFVTGPTRKLSVTSHVGLDDYE